MFILSINYLLFIYPINYYLFIFLSNQFFLSLFIQSLIPFIYSCILLRAFWEFSKFLTLLIIIQSLIHSFNQLFICSSFVHSFIVRSFIHRSFSSLIQSVSRSVVHSFVPSFLHSSFIHSVVLSPFIQLFSHSCI